MPTPEDHVTSLELSKRLAEHFKQRSLFGWIPADGEWHLRYIGPLAPAFYYPAYTASELGAMLPRSITHDGLDFYYEQQSLVDLAYVHHYNGEGGRIPDALFTVTGKTNEADARALLLLDLIAHDHIDLENDDG